MCVFCSEAQDLKRRHKLPLSDKSILHDVAALTYSS